MKSLLSLWLAMFLALLPAAPAAAQSKARAAVGAADAAAIRTVIEQQLDAFAADDPERAFSFAAPAIRELFGTPERFIGMVRRGYAAVVKPAAVVFLKPARIDGAVLQGVQLTDRQGAVWAATYLMQRQGDRSWRVGGVELQPSSARMI